MDIMRANRLATDADRAYAWQALMNYRGNGPYVDAAAIQHAADAFCDRVAYRVRAAELAAQDAARRAIVNAAPKAGA